MIFAFLCGVFYGALFWTAYHEAEEKKLDRKWQELMGYPFLPTSTDLPGLDKLTHTGYEDG